jgi:uncharacterized protein
MRVITVEEHFHHPEAVARVLQLSGPPPTAPDAEFGDFLQRFTPEQNSAERLDGRRLEHMDEVGIDIQVVSHGANNPSALDHPDAVDLCRKVNDDLAEQISRHPDRFRGFATIPLHDPEAAAEELRRCVAELGFVGTLVMGSCGGRFLDDRRFDAVLAAATDVDLPIYIHPGMPPNGVAQAYYTGDWPTAAQFMFAGPAFGWHAEAGIHVLRLILSGAFDRHPNLKVLSGHWAEVLGFWLERLDETFAWVGNLDRPVSAYYRDHVWATPSGMYSQKQLNFVVDALGADRIIHSEDFPYVVRDNVSSFLEEADLTDEQRHAIGHGNAEALLRI